MDQFIKDKQGCVSHIKWLMREDADSLVVSASSDKISCLQVWELREKSLPVHSSLGKNETQQFFNTVVSYFFVITKIYYYYYFNSYSCGNINAIFNTAVKLLL